jgi:protein-disulfide isomerase
MMKYPTEWKIKKAMFQTTNQKSLKTRHLYQPLVPNHPVFGSSNGLVFAFAGSVSLAAVVLQGVDVRGTHL